MPQNSEVLERASSLRVLGPRDMDLDTETENVLPPDVWHGVLWYLGAEVVGGCGCRVACELKEYMGSLPAQRTWTVSSLCSLFSRRN